MTFTNPRTLYSKLDYEGDEGVTWFSPDEFEDPYIREQLAIAIDAYHALDNAIGNLFNYIDNLEEEDGEE